tara:strand:+ start:1484 stop:1717 length:234 start_codon:yes stop_codon:yes gene_type:complete
MTAISQALKDIKEYLEIEGAQKIKVRYGIKQINDYKESKNVLLTFEDKECDFVISVSKINKKDLAQRAKEEGENGVL